MPVFLSMFTKEQEVISSGVQYSTIAFAFSTVIMISLSFEKIFQAVGRMKLTMISLMIGCISNIILDPLLIFGLCGFPALGVQGAAIASLVSAVVGALVIYGAGVAKKTLLRTGRSGLVGITGGFIRDFARVSMPAMLNESAWALGNLLYSSVYGHMGTGRRSGIPQRHV